MAKTFKIASIPGDGIGPEVINEGLRVLRALTEKLGNFSLEVEIFDWGSEYFLKNNKMMPIDGLKQLRDFDAIFLVPRVIQGFQIISLCGS